MPEEFLAQRIVDEALKVIKLGVSLTLHSVLEILLLDFIFRCDQFLLLLAQFLHDHREFLVKLLRQPLIFLL